MVHFSYVELSEKLSKKLPAKTKKKTDPQQATLAATPASTSSSSPTKLTLSPTKPTKATQVKKKQDQLDEEEKEAQEEGSAKAIADPDNSFRQFCQLCHDIEKEPSYNAKTKLVANYIKHGNSGRELCNCTIVCVKHWLCQWL